MRIIAIILLVSAVCQSIQAQELLVHKPDYTLPSVNNTGYILSADDGTNKWKDTIYYHTLQLRRCRYAQIQVTLMNITADTLEYINMSCSVLDVFTTNNIHAKIFPNRVCYKNNLTICRLPPYSCTLFEVPVCFYIDELGLFASTEFQIGMGLFKYDFATDIGYKMSHEKKHILWSNTLTVR